MNLSLSARALQFAATAHAQVPISTIVRNDGSHYKVRGQIRKYTGEPYIVHPIAVMDLVRQACTGNTDPAVLEDMLAAAALHDVIEDCGVTFEQLNAEFNSSVAAMVLRLSDLQTPADGNRVTRKANERVKLSTAGPAVQTIKLADLIDNTRSITARDPDFAVAYLREKRAILDVMTNGNPTLYRLADELAGSHEPVS